MKRIFRNTVFEYSEKMLFTISDGTGQKRLFIKRKFKLKTYPEGSLPSFPFSLSLFSFSVLFQRLLKKLREKAQVALFLRYTHNNTYKIIFLDYKIIFTVFLQFLCSIYSNFCSIWGNII